MRTAANATCDTRVPGLAAHQTDGRDAGEYQLNPGTGCGNPEPGAQLRKGPGVIYVAEERRLEIDQHCTDLVHFAPEILAGEAMTQLVDRDNDGAGQPEHHQIP